MVRKVQVSKEESGENLIKWLANRFTYHSSKEWYELIQQDKLLVNGQRPSSNYSLVEKDQISYHPDPRPEPEINRDFKILYQDQDLLVIDKPADLPCHPGGIYFHNTLWSLLKESYPQVHFLSRLDRETSGLMMVALNTEGGRYYFDLMKNKGVQKTYKVMVYGPFPDKLTATGYLAKDKESSIRKKRKFTPLPWEEKEAVEADLDKQWAHTEFQLIESTREYSLVEARLLTGKTHQIRATLSSLGYPVVGDKTYGPDEEIFLRFAGKTMTREDWTELVLTNQALHSYRLQFKDARGEDREFCVEHPEEWNPLLKPSIRQV